MDWKRFETIEDTNLKEGESINVKLLDIDPKTGKFKLSRKVLLEKPEGYVEPQPRERRERREGAREGGRNFERRGGDRDHREPRG